MGTCESCGREDEHTMKVQRIYLVPPEAADGHASHPDLESAAVPVAGDIEQWCASCCGTFPHVPIAEDAEDDPG